jgi:hypothetical protein
MAPLIPQHACTRSVPPTKLLMSCTMTWACISQTVTVLDQSLKKLGDDATSGPIHDPCQEHHVHLNPNLQLLNDQLMQGGTK